jgi:hypothetical protein
MWEQYAASVGGIVTMHKDKQIWACKDCGATTTNPDHRLIVYFHANCPARKIK